MKTSSKTSLKTCLTASLAFVGWLCAAGSAQAVEIRSVEVEKVDDEYRLVSQVWFDVDQAALYRVFIDFDLHHRFSTYTQASENVVIEDSPEPGFYIRNRACVLFFCREFERSGIVEAKPQHHIRATADAELSDFHVSEETWELETEATGTLVTYRWSVDPKFWIPPVVGPIAMRRKLENDSLGALERIEAFARAQAQ